MTIDEMLKRIKEKMACVYNISGCDTCNISSCEDIVIQLAEWLEELKCYKNDNDFSGYADKLYIIAFNNGCNKALDDFVKFANTMPTVEVDGEIRHMRLEEMAKQLKAGEQNKQSKQNT